MPPKAVDTADRGIIVLEFIIIGGVSIDTVFPFTVISRAPIVRLIVVAPSLPVTFCEGSSHVMLVAPKESNNALKGTIVLLFLITAGVSVTNTLPLTITFTVSGAAKEKELTKKAPKINDSIFFFIILPFQIRLCLS